MVRAREKRLIRPPTRFEDVDIAYFALNATSNIEVSEPNYFKEARTSRNGRKLWMMTKIVGVQIDI